MSGQGASRRRRRLTPVIATFVLGAGLAGPAGADTVLLTNGSYVTGDVEGSDLTLLTGGGAVKVSRGNLRELILGTLGGDVVRDATGRISAGVVEQPTYTIRLPSGQTLVFRRAEVSQIRFRAR